MSDYIHAYWREIEQALQTGDATEHTHRPALVRLLQRLQPDALIINEPKRIECGAPDLAVQRTLGGVRATVGYIETKDVDANLDDAERTEQLQRYRNALPNLILTNYREFRWYVQGELRMKATLTPSPSPASWERGVSSPLSHAVGEGGTGGEGEILALLHHFLHHAPQPIADADTLATQMAHYAHLIRDTLISTFQQGRESSLLHDLRQAIAETLLPDIDQPQHLPEFADMLAQTLAYGLFAARCYHDSAQPFTRASAAHEIPRTSPFLRQLFDTLSSPELETEPFVAFLDDLAYLLHLADMPAILQQFTQQAGREDAVVHFYETFLKAYDPRLRELRGVYYTPEPVVDYLVRSVHHLLQTEFGLAEGLATLRGTDNPVRADTPTRSTDNPVRADTPTRSTDSLVRADTPTRSTDSPVRAEAGLDKTVQATQVYILDPACGTGSFLAHILQFVRDYLHTHGLGGLWNDETRADLIQRLFGFELLMAPYVIAHLKLGLLLSALTPLAPLSHGVGEGGTGSPRPRGGRGAGGEGEPQTLTPLAPLAHGVGEGGTGSPRPRGGRGAGGEGEPQTLTPLAPLAHGVGEGGSGSPRPRGGRGAGGEGKQRLGIYLTNTLELPSEQIPMHLGPWRILSEEALHASRVKRETPILVVIGNPPYSGHSANQVEWLEALLRRDYYPKDARKEQNPKMLLDDYVKFIRWAQWRLEQTGQGILAFITNHSYLDNPTFRQMRRALMDAFDALYILDLHGNTRRKETAPDGSKDENVFDIQQGVALLIAVKRASNADRLQSDADRLQSDANRLQSEAIRLQSDADRLPSEADRLPSNDNRLPSNADRWLSDADRHESDADRFDASGVRGACAVYHAELWGRRAQKYAFLKAHDVSNTPWRALAPQPPLYLFVPYDATLQAEYEQGWLLTDIFRVHSTGVKTHRDHFVIDFDRATLERRIHEFRDLSIPDATLRQRYQLSDTRDWKLTPNRQRLASDAHWQAYFQPILYRPFDVRWIYYTPMVVELPREEVMGHMLRGANVALISARTNKSLAMNHFFVSTAMAEAKSAESTTQSYMFPLYLYHEEVGADGVVRVVREPNLRAEFVRALESALGTMASSPSEPATARMPSYQVTPEQILAYIYAMLHSPRYRARYAEFLRRDFPRIPLPQSAEQFYALAKLGQELIDYHLLRHPHLTRSPVKFPVAGSNRVEKGFPRYEGGRVWINKTQYFEGIDEAVWRFQVGGYQVCDKWLKDRRERTLSNAEIQTYRQMVFALQETLRLMGAIDKASGTL